MLVLSRLKNEKVVIKVDGFLITLTVLDVRKSGKVRLGFEAPDAVTINREEIQVELDRAISDLDVPAGNGAD